MTESRTKGNVHYLLRHTHASAALLGKAERGSRGLSAQFQSLTNGARLELESDLRQLDEPELRRKIDRFQSLLQDLKRRRPPASRDVS